MVHALVLGGGFGGLAAAHELRRRLDADDEVTLVAASDRFFVGFAKLWDLVGARTLERGAEPLAGLERHGIRFLKADVLGIDPDVCAVETTAGPLAGDGIVVALGSAHAPAHLALLGPRAHNLYDAKGLAGMRADLETLDEGRLVIAILGGPYLCPPAPFEAGLLLDEWLRTRGRRERVELAVSTPQPLTLPVAGLDASRYLADRLAEREVDLLTGRQVEAIDHGRGTIHFAGADTIEWQLLFAVPAAVPQPVLAASPLAGPSGWIEPDPRTFATGFERVYAVGDCTQVPTATAQLPKAGVFARAGGIVAAQNLAADLRDGERAEFDGYGYCFLELPGQRVAKVEGDFYAQPRPAVSLTPPDEAAFRAKQRWEQELLSDWLR
ncbi:MAG TPA: FAD/NAD(P)-binding oxidoreductase [Egibacteraceae bacterium]|nr:FAD/NAD(P)-binding oxidoreductase [Egibacteraceae bacterium]